MIRGREVAGMVHATAAVLRMGHPAARAISRQAGRVGDVLRLQRVYGNRWVQRRLASLSSSDMGRPLDAGVRARMESALGREFTDVRVHTGPEADVLTESLDAEAFTSGKDIFFRDQTYAPSTREGSELLAHELTHVVQQSGQGERPTDGVS